MTQVIVGVDGSPTAQRALRWALDLARSGDAATQVEVVHAWQPAVLGGPFVPVMVDPDTSREAAEQTVDAAIAAEDTTGVQVVRSLPCDGAAGALLAATEGADLVVVGSRGRGGFAGMLLGSVSHQVAHHAPCPVVVVRPDSERDQR